MCENTSHKCIRKKGGLDTTTTSPLTPMKKFTPKILSDPKKAPIKMEAMFFSIVENGDEYELGQESELTGYLALPDSVVYALRQMGSVKITGSMKADPSNFIQVRVPRPDFDGSLGYV